MNFVYISPNYPLRYFHFAEQLAHEGATVLGIGDTPYDDLTPDLRDSLREYYYVDSLKNTEQLEAGCRYFIEHYGPIDRLESNNEYWLEQDAHLRDVFNIPGLKTADMKPIKSKNAMKAVFKKAGIEVIEGILVNDLNEAKEAVATIGYPVVLKPDNGVGANYTSRIDNEADLEHFFSMAPPNTYLMEEFIVGHIHSFDGIVDDHGDVGFYSSLRYSAGVMEAVEQELDHSFGTPRVISPALVEAGLAAVKAFNLKGRYFHIEFFVRDKDGSIVALEANMRPPGEPCMDVINFSCDMDIYREYAKTMIHGTYDQSMLPPVERKYACRYVGRRSYKYNYKLSHDEIVNRFARMICTHEYLPEANWGPMGNEYYILRSDNEAALNEACEDILTRA